MTRLVGVLRLLILPRRVALAVALVLLLVVSGTASAGGLPGTPVPANFVGVNASPMLFDPASGVNGATQFDQMVSSGVQSIRALFNWSAAQPYRSWSQVPASQRSQFVNVHGVPTDFTTTDAIVQLAASHGLSVLPTVMYSPSWDARSNKDGGIDPPARTAPYANFLKALAHRYGTNGTFWDSHRPKLPVRMWQIWNEPNLVLYWPQPFAHSYVRLLRASYRALKHADPRAKVVMGALTNLAWDALGKVYAITGSHEPFDIVSVNGFTSTPARVIEFLRLVRRAMNRHGDARKPLLDTEISWPSALGQSLERFDWDTTEQGQAQDIAQLLPMLAAHRRKLHLGAFYYYTWITQEAPGMRDDFAYAGLVKLESSGQIVDKPGLRAFSTGALALERCRSKGKTATTCIH